MKVLVTGGSGLIGFHATKYYLEQGHDVTVLDNLSRSWLLRQEASEDRKHFNILELQKMGAKWLCESVGDPTAFMRMKTDFDVIIHLAAQTSVPTSINNPREDFSVNAIGTFDVLEYARQRGSKVVYASTNKVYPIHNAWDINENNMRYEWMPDEWHNNGFPVDGHLIHPHYAVGSRTPYGLSKYIGDLQCQEWYHTYGVKTGIFRQSCIASTHQFSFAEQGWLAHFVIQNLMNKPITVFGDGCQVRDILAAEDVVKAFDAFVQSDLKHGIWNAGGGPGQALSLNESIQLISQITGNEVPVTYEDWRPLDQKVYTSDISKLNQDLNWKPSVTLEQLVDNIVHWVHDNRRIFE